MKLIYEGKYNGNPETLPAREHMPNAVKFKEAESSKQMGIIANVIGIVIIVVLSIIFFLHSGGNINFWGFEIGLIASVFIIFPHEMLHAICFKQDVHLYTDLRHGIVFVIGTETMSKGRFVFMSLLPNIVFGFLTYIIFLFCPQLTFFGAFGAMTIGMGAGDYYNVFNALTQMPKGARTYLNQLNSYWYIPEKTEDEHR